MGERPERRDAEIAALRHGFDHGLTLVDTAEMYADGGSEEVVGQAIKGRRDQVFVVSKVYPHNAGKRSAIAACERSLKRLGIARLDLYLLHWRGDIPLAETVRGFEQLQQKGWIRHWGVSNFDVGDLEELQRVAGAQACAANQVYYSLSERGVEFDLLPRMRALRMPLMAYSPIDGGRILRNAKLAKLAESLNLSAAQLSLAWLLRQPGVMAIPKAGREPHLFENWQSRDVTLPQQVLSELETVFAKPSRKHPLAMR